MRILIRLLIQLPSHLKAKLLFCLCLILASTGFELLVLQRLNSLVSYIKSSPGLVSIQTLYLQAAIFLASIIVSSLIKTISSYTNLSTSARVGSFLSVESFRTALQQSLSATSIHTPEYVISMVTNYVEYTVVAMNALLAFLTSLLLLAAVTLYLLTIGPYLFTITATILSLGYLSYSKYALPALKKLGQTVVELFPNNSTYVASSVRLSSELNILNAALRVETRFLYLDKRLRTVQAKAEFIKSLPRFYADTLLIVSLIVASSSILILEIDSLQGLLSEIAILTFASLRLLPSANQLYHSLANINNHKLQVAKVYDAIISTQDSLYISSKRASSTSNTFIRHKPVNSADASVKSATFHLSQISLQFAPEKQIISDCNLYLPNPGNICITGPSGVGKSSLLKILAGVEIPTAGSILADGFNLSNPIEQSAWLSKIAYLPQDTYTYHDSIFNNITLFDDMNSSNIERAERCLSAAMLSSWLDQQPKRTSTYLGPSGIMLSGGQRQRLAIARALYAQRKTLLMDETTSALDKELEASLLHQLLSNEQINQIILVTHRTSLAPMFDTHISIQSGSPFVARISTQ